MKIRRSIKHLAYSVLILAIQAESAFAQSMPWETPLQRISDSVSGPVARALGVGAIVVTGLGLAFGEGGGGMRKGLWVVFGLCVTFAATSFFLSFFGA